MIVTQTGITAELHLNAALELIGLLPLVHQSGSVTLKNKTVIIIII